jgi:hypothetical protein
MYIPQHPTVATSSDGFQPDRQRPWLRSIQHNWSDTTHIYSAPTTDW